MRSLVVIFLLGLSVGLLIGLRQQHKQKDYMIKILLATPVSNSVSVPNLPRIGDLK